MAPDALQRELFRLFYLRPNWKMGELAIKTKQPRDVLHAALSEVALLNRAAGALRDTWALKPEYSHAGTALDSAGAEGGASGAEAGADGGGLGGAPAAGADAWQSIVGDPAP